MPETDKSKRGGGAVSAVRAVVQMNRGAGIAGPAVDLVADGDGDGVADVGGAVNAGPQRPFGHVGMVAKDIKGQQGGQSEFRRYVHRTSPINSGLYAINLAAMQYFSINFEGGRRREKTGH